jgi:hypothetical protein
MKLSYAGAGVALILAATLAACGGKAQFSVQGTIANLKNSGLVLANNGNTLNVPAGATSYAFPQQIDYGTSYNVTFQKQPDHMTCGFDSINTGSAGQYTSIAVAISCSQNAYALTGQFTGLTPAADGTARTITLVNGSTGGATITSTASGAGDFVISPSVPDGDAYGVTVLAPPATPANGLTCTLTNGSGVMHESAIGNLILTCVPTT